MYCFSFFVVVSTYYILLYSTDKTWFSSFLQYNSFGQIKVAFCILLATAHMNIHTVMASRGMLLVNLSGCMGTCRTMTMQFTPSSLKGGFI